MDTEVVLFRKRDQVKASQKPRVLLNIVRLLPESKGAGGAGRLVMALLTHLPGYVDLRVAIAPHSEYLLPRFPNLAFVVVQGDSNLHLDEHLDWCECYIDPLNGLRPTNIKADIAVISMLLDLQHMEMPWFFSDAEIKSRIAEYSYAINRSDHLIAISEYEKNNFKKYYDVSRVTVMYLAGFMAEDSKGTKQSRISDAGDRGDYLIYPAVPWQHKNHEILIQAIGVLKGRGVRIPVVLTNTGGRTEMKKKLGDVADAHGVSDLVSLEAYLPEDELFTLFTGSTGMVFPTLYEGFGIPLVDAMALGVPVLTTKTSAVPEICGDAAAYFSNPSNAIAMADDLELFWNDLKIRSERRKRAFRQAELFSSENMAVSLLGAIRTAIARKKAVRQKLPPQGNFTPPRFLPLSVLILYSDLSEEDRDWLCSLSDLHAWHASRFGPEADITVAVDIDLSKDKRLQAIFRRLPKLIICGGKDEKYVDHAVLDFSNRYDQSDLQLVVKFDASRLARYSIDHLNLAIMSLRLHQEADYAVFDDDVNDCTLDAVPSEIDGVTRYDVMQRGGATVFDTIVKRTSSHGLRNGSSRYLSRLCTKLRRLRVPGE